MIRYFAASLLLSASLLHANGTRLPYQDMDAVARGYAFAATADSPAAIYYNPAGLGQLENGALQTGANLLRPETRFTRANGQGVEAAEKTFVVPFVFAAQPVRVGGQPFVLGAGMYAPFGLSSEWSPANSGFRTLATNAELVFRRYALTAATRVHEQFLIGASLQYNRTHVDLSRGLGFVPGDAINFTGRGDSWSYNAGLLYRPSAQHAFGVQYQAEVEPTLEGATSYAPLGFSEASTTDWVFPSNFTVSYSFRPNADWNFEVGYDRTRWSRFNTVVLKRSVSGPLPLTFGWKDSTYYEFGGTRFWRNGWRVSAGGCWSGNSVPDATFNPAVVDYDRWLWNAGVGFKASRWNVMTLLQYSPRKTRVVGGSAPSLAGESADGRYDSRLLAAGVQMTATW